MTSLNAQPAPRLGRTPPGGPSRQHPTFAPPHFPVLPALQGAPHAPALGSSELCMELWEGRAFPGHGPRLGLSLAGGMAAGLFP